MRRIRYKDLLDRNSHLSYEELVALVSDETSLDGFDKIRKHLDSCWHCQARHQELKEGVVEIVQNLTARVGDLSSTGADRALPPRPGPGANRGGKDTVPSH